LSNVVIVPTASLTGDVDLLCGVQVSFYRRGIAVALNSIAVPKVKIAFNGLRLVPKTGEITAQRQAEDFWAEQVKSARFKYKLAESHYRQLIAGQEKWPLPEPDASISIHAARLQELDARSEYLQSLKLFVELLVFGELPE
jgi:hypothetical protein